MTAYMAWCGRGSGVDPIAGDRYLALFTNHYRFEDIGIGLMLVAASIAALMRILSASDRSTGESWLRTPQRRGDFLGLGVTVLAFGWLTAIYSFEADARRMQFPWCADTILIPIVETSEAFVIIAPPLVLLGWITTLCFGSLPTALGQWDARRPVRSWMVSVLLALPMLVVGAAAISSFGTSMAVSMPAFVVAFYLLTSTRAALLSPRKADPV